MHTRLHIGRGAAILTFVTSLAGTAIAVAPDAASAHSASKCASKSVVVKPPGDPSTHVPVKAITVEGDVSCDQAYKVIAAALAGKPPSGWKTRAGSFKAPDGLAAEEVVNGSKKIKFAVRAG